MRKMRLTNKVTKALRGNSKGLSLIEVLIAVALLGVVAGAFLGGVDTAYKADIIAAEQTNAESLARSELEYIRNSTYTTGGFSYVIPGTSPPCPAGHTALDSYYAGYSVSVTGQPIDPDTHLPTGLDKGMQQITVEVYHQGKTDPVLTTSNYKVNR